MNEQNQAENADFTNTVSQLVLSTQHLVTMVNDIAPLESHRRYGGQTQADHIRFLGNKIIKQMKKPQFKFPDLTNNVLPPSQLPTRTMF